MHLRIRDCHFGLGLRSLLVIVGFGWAPMFGVYFGFSGFLDTSKEGSEIYQYLEEKNYCQFFENLVYSGYFLQILRKMITSWHIFKQFSSTFYPVI